MEKKNFKTQGRREFLSMGAGLGAGLVLKKNLNMDSLRKQLQTGEDMSFFETVKNRHSVRKYKSAPVPKEHLNRILNAARLAPNSGNQQAWRFLVVNDREKLERLKTMTIQKRTEVLRERGEKVPQERVEELETHFENLFSAPIYVLILIDKTVKYPQYADKDGAIAGAHIMLAARALGYGTVFFTDSIPEELCKEVLNIPDRYSRICIIPVGIPYEWPEASERKPLKDLVYFNEIG